MSVGAGYREGYRQAFEDIAELLENLAGTAGPGSYFTSEGAAAVGCVEYMLRYGTWDEASMCEGWSDDKPRRVSDYIKVELLDIKPNTWGQT